MHIHPVHLVGSAPLSCATEMFELVGSILNGRAPRIPDGETGERAGWITALEPVFSGNPQFERSTEVLQRANNRRDEVWHRYRVKDDVPLVDVQFNNLRDAKSAIESYREFARLKGAGKIGAHCRFQVQLASSVSVIRRYVIENQQPEIEHLYDKALYREIEKMVEVIPSDQLAIQWDLASAIFERLERGEPTRYGKTREDMMEVFTDQAAELGKNVPPGVDLLFHLCYGDHNHRHSIEPSSLIHCVNFANLLSLKCPRPIQLFHMPVPRGRSDDAYFAPLTNLQISEKTEISLGLVHYTDGVAGTRQRLATARKYLPRFLIATECGFGRRPKETIPELLKIHAQVSDNP